ncbi:MULTISPECIES: hypothetical protein [Cupriavidus]|uniref:Uncharacterized protein n=1 Tax=Cupriavidus oxalaticus TaxID=96344 RepID=A0A4P7L4T8_9BURK|nr:MULTISPECIES: hypothetical protein [Cupriavidus]QBY50330.1 hypothetical protein E0W60_03720 [Cupriavidus oxalaticus]TDF63986.1 hypothetical protein E1J61_19895 [Cupriavidus sp. L7L]
MTTVVVTPCGKKKRLTPWTVARQTVASSPFISAPKLFVTVMFLTSVASAPTHRHWICAMADEIANGGHFAAWERYG